MKAVAPQGSVLGPFQYLLYTSDFSQVQNVFNAAFANDIAMLAIEQYVEIPTNKLPQASDQIYNCIRQNLG